MDFPARHKTIFTMAFLIGEITRLLTEQFSRGLMQQWGLKTYRFRIALRPCRQCVFIAAAKVERKKKKKYDEIKIFPGSGKLDDSKIDRRRVGELCHAERHGTQINYENWVAFVDRNHYLDELKTFINNWIANNCITWSSHFSITCDEYVVFFIYCHELTTNMILFGAYLRTYCHGNTCKPMPPSTGYISFIFRTKERDREKNAKFARNEKTHRYIVV